MKKRKEEKPEARKSTGVIKIWAVDSLDEALAHADAFIREFVGERDFVIGETNSVARPLTEEGSFIKGWDVTLTWWVI